MRFLLITSRTVRTWFGFRVIGDLMMNERIMSGLVGSGVLLRLAVGGFRDTGMN
jgi:hypothetical protein